MADIKKFVEEVKTLTVLELNELVKALETEFGVSAAAATVVAAEGGVAAPVVEEKTEFNVVLKEVGPNKISVIKAIREITALGLIEAKAIVDKVPSTVKEAQPKEFAEQIAEKLKAAGAVVELQ
ncbi:MAG: 50S ribosomal protein L7/L12 [Clostridia bacterium]